jgi:NhaP-type Na+/H+ or K+/H+ antiporter
VGELAHFGVLIVGYGLVARRAEGTAVTAPMVFAAGGLIVGALGGSFGVEEAGGGEPLEITESARHIAEVALVLLLFTDAARIDLLALRRGSSLPVRLLLIGLPLTVGLGGLAALALFSGTLGTWEALLVGAILAPTDAALGAVVVLSPKLPLRLRQTLNVEAGLNDGLAVPFFTVFAVLAAESAVGEPTFVRVAFEKIGYGAAVGLALGFGGGWLLRRAAARGWTAPVFEQLAVLSVALLAWWAAEELGGSGLIAAFVGGMAYGGVARAIEARSVAFAEDVGQLLSLLVFFTLGAVGAVFLDDVTWEMVLYAVLSLTAIRMLPVGVALRREHLRPWTVAYLGWFGPRGLASILLALILLLEYPTVPGGETIFLIVMLTVLVSVFAHGASAAPLTERYSRSAASRDAGEQAPAPELRARGARTAG